MLARVQRAVVVGLEASIVEVEPPTAPANPASYRSNTSDRFGILDSKLDRILADLAALRRHFT